MKRQTVLGQSFLNNAPLLVALFSILVTVRLVALDLDPVWVGGSGTIGFSRGVAVSGNYAYVAAETAGLQVIDLSNPANPQRVGGYDSSGIALGVAVSGTYAYLADANNGLQVIDVSNPANPQGVGGYDTSGLAFGGG